MLAAARFDTTPCPVPSWLPGGDSQTVYAALFAQYHRIAFVRDRVETPDTDFVDFDWTGPGLFPHKAADGARERPASGRQRQDRRRPLDDRRGLEIPAAHT